MAKKTKIGVIKKTPTQKPVKKVKEVKEPKTVKPVKKVTSAAVTRLKARLAKWDGSFLASGMVLKAYCILIATPMEDW